MTIAVIRAPVASGSRIDSNARRGPGSGHRGSPSNLQPRGGPAVDRDERNSEPCAACHNMSRIRTDFYTYRRARSIGSLQLTASPPRSPPEHAQTQRVPAITSPWILRPIYTHTPAANFPYSRPGDSTVSRIGARFIRISRDRLHPMARSSSISQFPSKLERVASMGGACRRKRRPRGRRGSFLADAVLKITSGNEPRR